jgi:hypothetical protein
MGAVVSFMSKQAPGRCDDALLASQAAHCGHQLESAIKHGDRDLALVWQAAMFGIVQLRRDRLLVVDTQHEGGRRGG